MRCALCHRFTLARRRKFGHPVSMTGRFCSRCLPIVAAADVGGVVTIVEVEFSTAFQAMRSAA